MNKYATEFIGTFFLVFTIGMSVALGAPLAAVAIGCVLMVMVYMGGPISGAHYNPAVTIAVYLRGKCAAADVVPYIAAQLLAAIAASAVVLYLKGEPFLVSPGPDVPVLKSLLCEALFTFALVLVVLNVATSRRAPNNHYYGAAIGFTVLAGAVAVGGVSGGAFNPAVGLGPNLVRALAGAGNWGHCWIYIVGPLVGALAAVPVFKMQEGGSPDRAPQPAAKNQQAPGVVARGL